MDGEILAIIDFMCHFIHMMLGCSFQVFTDHKPQTTYFTQNRGLTAYEARYHQEQYYFQPGMQFQYFAVNENMLSDAFSYKYDYRAIEIKLVQGSSEENLAANILVDDCFEYLLRGRMVAEQTYASFQQPLPYRKL